jgi:hypothetical protein
MFGRDANNMIEEERAGGECLKCGGTGGVSVVLGSSSDLESARKMSLGVMCHWWTSCGVNLEKLSRVLNSSLRENPEYDLERLRFDVTVLSDDDSIPEGDEAE